MRGSTELSPKRALSAYSAALSVVAVLGLTACTGTDLGGGLASAGFDETSLVSSAAATGDTELALTATGVESAASDSAVTEQVEPASGASQAESEKPAGTIAIARAVPAAATGAPVPPLPLAGTPDTSLKDSVAPSVLALAPTNQKRRLSFAALGSRADRAEQPDRRTTRTARRVEVAPRTTRIVKPRKAGAALPGVRSRSSLFQIGRAEPNEAARSFTVASAAGLARLSKHGFRKQTAHVKTECFAPRLVRTLRYVEQHYGKPVMVTSGYRSPKGNRRAGGARKSKHVTCEAADFQVEGVSKWELAKFLRGLPGRGGVGTYCHTKSVHYDVGSKRDWNWGCRGK